MLVLVALLALVIVTIMFGTQAVKYYQMMLGQYNQYQNKLSRLLENFEEMRGSIIEARKTLESIKTTASRLSEWMDSYKFKMPKVEKLHVEGPHNRFGG
jgi:predicted PurR-regulated permease PerM